MNILKCCNVTHSCKVNVLLFSSKTRTFHLKMIFDRCPLEGEATFWQDVFVHYLSNYKCLCKEQVRKYFHAIELYLQNQFIWTTVLHSQHRQYCIRKTLQYRQSLHINLRFPFSCKQIPSLYKDLMLNIEA